MTNSCQSSETIETPFIDVESEPKNCEQMTQFLRDQSIYIPDRYRTQMAKTGLLDRFIELIENESIIIKQIQEVLNKHHISIPAEFYPQLIQTNIFESILDTVHDVNRQPEIEATRYFQIFYPPKKRPYDVIDTNEDGIESHHTTEKPTKTLKTADDNVSNDEE